MLRTACCVRERITPVSTPRANVGGLQRVGKTDCNDLSGALRGGDEPDSPLIGEVGISPLDEHQYSVPEPDQVGDVNAKPQPPREAATHPEPAEVRYGSAPSDGRDISFVDVAKRAAR